VDKYPGNLIQFRKAVDFLCYYAVGVGVLSTFGAFAATFCAALPVGRRGDTDDCTSYYIYQLRTSMFLCTWMLLLGATASVARGQWKPPPKRVAAFDHNEQTEVLGASIYLQSTELVCPGCFLSSLMSVTPTVIRALACPVVLATQWHLPPSTHNRLTAGSAQETHAMNS
jgi:hypothetical protein